MRSTNYEHIKEIPGYKVVLQTILKSLIQQMVEQLAEYGEEETVILTTSVANACFSPLGSKSGLAFLEQRTDIRSDFLKFCLRDASQFEERNPRLEYWNNSRYGLQSDETISVDEDSVISADPNVASHTVTQPTTEILYAENHGKEGEGKRRVFLNRHEKLVDPLVKDCLKYKIIGSPYTDTDECAEGITQKETADKTTDQVKQYKTADKTTDQVTGHETVGKTIAQVNRCETAGKTTDQVTQHEIVCKTTNQTAQHKTPGKTTDHVTHDKQKGTEGNVSAEYSSDLDLVHQTTKTLSSEGAEVAKFPRVLVHKIRIPQTLQHATFVLGPDNHMSTDGQISRSQRIPEILNQRIPGSPNRRTPESSLVQTPQNSLMQTEKEDESVATQTDSERDERSDVKRRNFPSKTKYPGVIYPLIRPPVSFSNQPPLRISYYFSQSQTEISNYINKPEPKSSLDQSQIGAYSMRLPNNVIGANGPDTDNDQPIKVEVTEDNELTDISGEEFKWNKDYNYTIITDESSLKEDSEPTTITEECNVIDDSKHSAMNEIELKEEPVDVITSDNSSSGISVVSLSQQVVGENLISSSSSNDNCFTNTPFVPDSDSQPVETDASFDSSAATIYSDSSGIRIPLVNPSTVSSKLTMQKTSGLKRTTSFKSQPSNVNRVEKQQMLAYLKRKRKSPDPDTDLSDYLMGTL